MPCKPLKKNFNAHLVAVVSPLCKHSKESKRTLHGETVKCIYEHSVICYSKQKHQIIHFRHCVYYIYKFIG